MMPTYENEKSKVIKEFSRFAHKYESYNVIQSNVSKVLVDSLVIKKIPTIIDIGCGSGTVYKNILNNQINFEHFVALDSSKEMLSLHPDSALIAKHHADFNEIATYENLISSANETLLLSSSSLQWSRDLDFSFKHLATKASKAYFAIFTANTFKTLHKTAKVNSPIYEAEALMESIQKYYAANFSLKEYRLEFENTREMFNYIKKSGVSGGEKRLSYKQTKQLMKDYPLNYLEFEVLFVEATSLSV
jgi:malonyl-CoA O-methyltransferase